MLVVKPVVRPLFLTFWLIAAASGVFEMLPTSRIRPLLSTMLLVLQTAPETRALLQQRGVPYHIEETKAAVELYNRLSAAGEAVGGLFHSTC